MGHVGCAVSLCPMYCVCIIMAHDLFRVTVAHGLFHVTVACSVLLWSMTHAFTLC